MYRNKRIEEVEITNDSVRKKMMGDKEGIHRHVDDIVADEWLANSDLYPKSADSCPWTDSWQVLFFRDDWSEFCYINSNGVELEFDLLDDFPPRKIKGVIQREEFDAKVKELYDDYAEWTIFEDFYHKVLPKHIPGFGNFDINVTLRERQ